MKANVSQTKQTEIGILPVTWEAVAIKTICKLINGRGFKPYEWSDRGLPIIRIQNLNGSKDFNYFNGSYNPKIEINHGQLLFAWSGSRGTSFGPHVWNGSKAVLNYHTWKLDGLATVLFRISEWINSHQGDEVWQRCTTTNFDVRPSALH